jgi:ketosteroid isomerase-like protein
MEMRRSPEIEQLVRDMVGAVDRGDADAAKRMLSGEEGVVMIGTSPDEYTRSQEGMGQMIEDSTPEGSQQIHMSVDDVHGYELGDVAWADSTGGFMRDHETVATRFTTVFHREQGEWRCVQAHASIGVANERMFDTGLSGGSAIKGRE